MRAKSIITVVRDRLKEWEGAGEKRRRARRPDDQFRHELMVEALVCDALRRNIVAPGGAVAVSLSKDRRSRYEPTPYKPMRGLLDALSSDELKILTFTLGQKPEIGRGRRTTISVGPALTDMAVGLTLDDFGRRSGGEPIILRQAHQRVAQYGGEELADAFEIFATTGAELGEIVSYPDHPEADRLRDQMHRVNDGLDQADIVCNAVSIKSDKFIDAGDRWLRRVFNNGHFDLRHGGRLTGGFWMEMSKAARRKAIRLQGEPITELDFKAMMPRLLYARNGESYPPQSDPYLLPGLSPPYRGGVKTMFSALLYGPTALKQWPRGCARKFGNCHRHEDILALLRRHHEAVASRFGTLVGFEMMRTESDIMVRILLTCLSRDIAVLPIHDAVLAPTSRADDVAAVMLDVFHAETGAEAALSRH